MSDLDSTESLFKKVFENYKFKCPVCKELMPEDEDKYVTALRIRDSYENRKKYGEDIIVHPLNGIYVCGNICKERVARAWEREDSKDKVKELVESITEDNKRFKEACIKAQKLLYLPKPKRKK